VNAEQGAEPARDDDGQEPTQPREAEQEIVLSAVRDGRAWVIAALQEGIFVHARNLRALAESAQDAVALRGDGPVPAVRVRPCSPQLDALAEARERYEQALAEAVRGLRLQRATWSDVAAACGVRAAEARAAFQSAEGEARGS
jgi:hypothetical protein